MEDFNSMNGKSVISVKELKELRKQCASIMGMVDKMLSVENLSSKAMATYILNGACDCFSMTPTEIRRGSHSRDLVDMRRIIIHLLRSHTTETLIESAHLVGLTNHATAIHHLRKANDMLSDSPFRDRDFKIKYERVKEKLKL